MKRDDWLRHLAWFAAEFRDSEVPFKEAFKDYFGDRVDELFGATDELFFDCAEIEAGVPVCEDCGYEMDYHGRAWLGSYKECDMFHCSKCDNRSKESYTGDFPFFTHGRVSFRGET